MQADSNTHIPTEAPPRNTWQALKDAIRGTGADYTQIPVKRAVFLLAVPMILELVMESTFAVVDIFFVSKLGAAAVATVGLTETFLFLVYSVAMGSAMAVTAIVSRRIGEKNKEEAGKAAIQAIFIAILASIPFSIGGIFFAKELLSLVGDDPWVLTQGYRYAQWMLGGNLVIMLLFVMNAIFRGAGDAAIAMWVLLVANGLNIILDPMLIFGWGPFPAMGIEGAAIATNIGRGVGVLIQLYVLFRGGKHIRARLTNLYWDAKLILDILRTSAGGIAQMIIGMTSWIFIMAILDGVSTEAVAGATITVRIMMFVLMPAWGLSNATATLVGQNLGAGHPERAVSAVWRTGIYNMCFLVLVSAVFFFFNTSLPAIFTDDVKVIAMSAEWLRILSFSFFVYGWWMVSVQAFNGAGDTKTPTYINFVFFWLIQIPLAWYLALHLDWKQSGVFWAVFLSETSVGIFTLWLFTRGKWKEVKV